MPEVETGAPTDFRWNDVDNGSAENLSLLNFSPVERTPRVTPRLTSVYFTSPFSKNRRSRRLLERRDRLSQQVSASGNDASASRVSHSLSAAFRPKLVSKPPPLTSAKSAPGTREINSLSYDVTDRRRQQFLSQRRFLIQKQIRRRLNIGANSASSASDTIDVDGFHDNERHDVITELPTQDLQLNLDSAHDPDADADTAKETGTSCDSEVVESSERPSLTRRRSSLVRTSSFAVRSANQITRRAVNIIGASVESKRRQKQQQQRRARPKSRQEMEAEEKQLASKYSMRWMAKAVETKRFKMVDGIDDMADHTVSCFTAADVCNP